MVHGVAGEIIALVQRLVKEKLELKQDTDHANPPPLLMEVPTVVEKEKKQTIVLYKSLVQVLLHNLYTAKNKALPGDACNQALMLRSTVRYINCYGNANNLYVFIAKFPTEYFHDFF